MGKPFWENSSVWKGVTNGYGSFKSAAKSAAKSGWEHSLPHAIYDAGRNAASSSSYSDFVSKSNEVTNGWYSTISGATPLLSGLHNAILGRDSALDYLNNTGFSWSDLPGYQSSRLTGGTSSGITDIGRDVGKIADGIHDLGQFYSGDPKVSSFTNNMYG